LILEKSHLQKGIVDRKRGRAMGLGPIGIILEDIVFLLKIRPPETEYSVIISPSALFLN
jgi:hypothetical protein